MLLHQHRCFPARIIVVEAEIDAALIVSEGFDSFRSVNNGIQHDIVVLHTATQGGEAQHVKESLKYDHRRVFSAEMGSYTLRSCSTLVEAASEFVASFVIAVCQSIKITITIPEGIMRLLQELLCYIYVYLPAV